jgi:site-specific DNA-methyltransferase (adenine-specific)
MAKFREEMLSDNVRLFLGDARDVVPTLRGIDAVVVDPPYGIQDLIGGYGRTQLSKDRGGSNDRHIANDKNLDVVGEVFALARKVLAKNAWVAAFYSCRITPTFFKMMGGAGYREDEYFGEVVWDKKAPGLGTQIRYCHENVAFFRVGKPEPLADCMSLFSYVALKGETRSGEGSHPHEKPDQVMQNIVRVVPGKVVLDPFAGTFSTGAAAVKLRRGFIGIELDPKYFEVGLKKVSAALKQPEAFWEGA